MELGYEIRSVGSVPAGLGASFGIPTLPNGDVSAVLTPCLLMAMLASLESYAIGFKFALQNNYSIDASQELVALGFANFAAAFSGGYPAAGSFSCTSLSAEAGSRTPFTNIITGSMVLLVLSFGTSGLHYIPKSALAAIIEVAVVNLVDIKAFHHAYKVTTTTSTILLLSYPLSFVLYKVL